MAANKRATSGELSRAIAQTRRAARANEVLVNDLPAPTPVDVYDLGDDVYLIPVDRLGSGVDFRFPRWESNAVAEPPLQDILKVFVDGISVRFTPAGTLTPVFSAGYNVPVEDNYADPIMFKLAGSVLTLNGHGTRRVQYEIDVKPGGGPVKSGVVEVQVDLLDPNLTQTPEALIAPDDLDPPGVITKDYLDDNTEVVFDVPEYLDPQPFDRIAVYFNDFDVSPIADEELDQTGGPPYSVSILSSAIRNRPEGLNRLHYVLTDRVGNPSKLSDRLVINLALTSPPIAVLAPDVDPDTDIDRADAQFGVSMLIPDYGNSQPGDKIMPMWGAYALSEVTVGNHTFPLPISVPYSILKLPNATEEHQFDIQYTVHRGNQPYPSLTTPVTVDLRQPGPENPGPGPINENLPPPTLQGQGDNPASPMNTLKEADEGRDADVTFEEYTPINAGEYVQLIYGDSPVGAPQLVDSFIGTGEIKLELPWSVINLVGNGEIPLAYRIGDGGAIWQQSPPQTIDVDIFNIASLAIPRFTSISPAADANERPTISCTHRPWFGIPVEMKDVALKAGDEISLKWMMYADLKGTIPIQASEGSFFIEVQVDHDTPGSGGERFIVPFAKYADQAVSGSIRIYYVVTKRGSNIRGRSPQEHVWISRYRAGGGICTESNP